MVIGTNYISSCKSNHHTITVTIKELDQNENIFKYHKKGGNWQNPADGSLHELQAYNKHYLGWRGEGTDSNPWLAMMLFLTFCDKQDFCIYWFTNFKSSTLFQSFKEALAMILTKKITCFGNWYIALKWWNKGKYFTLNSLSYHFSPFVNENYHRFIISLLANNLTSLSPYATDLTSDR